MLIGRDINIYIFQYVVFLCFLDIFLYLCKSRAAAMAIFLFVVGVFMSVISVRVVYNHGIVEGIPYIFGALVPVIPGSYICFIIICTLMGKKGYGEMPIAMIIFFCHD